MRDYQLVSPSLEGVLSHDSIMYEGIKRPIEILRILDGPATKGRGSNDQCSVVNVQSNKLSEKDFRILQEYFYDLYGVFMKKFSHFLIENDVGSDDSVKLQAMLQEIIKVKKWVVGR